MWRASGLTGRRAGSARAVRCQSTRAARTSSGRSRAANRRALGLLSRSLATPERYAPLRPPKTGRRTVHPRLIEAVQEQALPSRATLWRIADVPEEPRTDRARGTSGGLVHRSRADPRADSSCGWSTTDGRLVPELTDVEKGASDLGR